jgi:N-acetylglutamate synthase-like GNAT family acetyltransferase
MPHELRPVRSSEDRRHLHHIRRTILFASERHSVSCDENHPENRAEENLPLLLLLDARPIGVVRLDLRGETAVVRLVAVAEREQGKGHGKTLNALVEAEARRRGVKTLRVNAAPEALGYYEKMGWRRASWDKSELVGLAKDCVQMRKEL